jgi:hypothetical protein
MFLRTVYASMRRVLPQFAGVTVEGFPVEDLELGSGRVPENGCEAPPEVIPDLKAHDDGKFHDACLFADLGIPPRSGAGP